MFEVIPAIDLLDGQVVRLKQGKYNDVTEYDIDPVSLARQYEEAGASRIHIVDLNGAREGKPVNHDAIKKVREAVSCNIEIGGGIRNTHTAENLIRLGIDYLVLGSLLIKDPETSKSICDQFPNKVIAGIDAHDMNVATDGWESTDGRSVASLLDTVNNWPIAGVIFTDISRDGMMSGPNIGALKEVAQQSKAPVIASGGVRSKEDIDALSEFYNEGIQGCIIGKAILSGSLPLHSIFSATA